MASSQTPAQGDNSWVRFIDHTLLRPEASATDYSRLCAEAAEHNFFSVCVPPALVEFCGRELRGTLPKICTVVGFPLGHTTSAAKAFETRLATSQGAAEIDMVIALHALKGGDWSAVAADIAAVVEAADGALVKVILETHLLTDDEKRRACETACAAGARFVKTSTGFTGGGATLADVRLMAEAVKGRAQVKASGGIRSLSQVKEYLAAGATRIGTSSAVAMLTGSGSTGSY